MLSVYLGRVTVTLSLSRVRTVWAWTRIHRREHRHQAQDPRYEREPLPPPGGEQEHPEGHQDEDGADAPAHARACGLGPLIIRWRASSPIIAEIFLSLTARTEWVTEPRRDVVRPIPEGRLLRPRPPPGARASEFVGVSMVRGSGRRSVRGEGPTVRTIYGCLGPLSINHRAIAAVSVRSRVI